MSDSKYKMGASAATLLAVLVSLSSIVTGDMLSGQPQLVRLVVSILVAVVIATVVFFVSKRLAGNR